ncbi:hypothetical protein JRO89_XS01G0230700 [Xanthoceras sorbifolium]|uniref:Cytochrome P450 724B1 n=1 Tax=Xanthoceras sorbifolium TaxID=99658 RepID=A0ABQ8IKV3_9ROSI|nr:hypothetical protein JRO89_XS01G0230700 [Xanthoceras sorbifolium]
MEAELLSIVLALALALLSLYFLVIHNMLAKQETRNLPPGTMGWPICGETLSLLKPHRSNSMGTFLQQHCSRYVLMIVIYIYIVCARACACRYGKVFKSHLFGSPAIVSCDNELNMFILQNEGKLFRASYPKAMHGILGNFSLLVVSGDLHKKLRNVVISFTCSSNPLQLSLVLSKICPFQRSSHGQVVKKSPSAKKLERYFALNLIVKLLLSIEPGEPQAFKILEDFRTYMRGFISLPVYIPGMPYAKAVKARARLSSTVKEIIKEREKGTVEVREGDFLDVILSKGGMSNEEIVSIVLDILLGGYETTATLIALIVYFLGHAPIAFQTLKEEHQAIRKNKKVGEPLNWEDYQKMEFTCNVIYEAMRCGNVVKFVHRKALKDVKFKEYIIPSGWKVLPMFTGAHVDPSLHENPTEFNPWRWSTDKVMSKKVMPFGGGPRLCPGAELAKVEISFFLHHLVLNYRWKTKADDFPVAYPFVEFTRGLLLEIERNKDDEATINNPQCSSFNFYLFLFYVEDVWA